MQSFPSQNVAAYCSMENDSHPMKKTKNKANNKQIETLKTEMAKRPWLCDVKDSSKEWLHLSNKLNELGNPKTIQKWKQSWRDQEKNVLQCVQYANQRTSKYFEGTSQRILTPSQHENRPSNHSLTVESSTLQKYNTDNEENEMFTIKTESSNLSFLDNNIIPFHKLQPTIVKAESVPVNSDVDQGNTSSEDEVTIVGFTTKVRSNIEPLLKVKKETGHATTSEEPSAISAKRRSTENPSTDIPEKQYKAHNDAITRTTAEAALNKMSEHNNIIVDLLSSIKKLTASITQMNQENTEFKASVIRLLEQMLEAVRDLNLRIKLTSSSSTSNSSSTNSSFSSASNKKIIHMNKSGNNSTLDSDDEPK